MRFHENSETEQAGVVAPGAGTSKVSREEAVLEDFCYLFLPSPSGTQGDSGQGFICAHMASCTCADR